jgi:hypothetical protein
MPRFFSLFGALLMSYLPSLMACEGCKEPSNVAGDSGVGGISAGFSWSVVFMLGMLTLLMSGMVLMMVRSCRQLAEQRQRVDEASRFGANQDGSSTPDQPCVACAAVSAMV